VSKGEVSLKIDGIEYKMESMSDSLDVFQQLTKTSFKNIGTVKQKLRIISPISSPIEVQEPEEHKAKTSTPSYTTKKSIPLKLSIISKRLIQLLALGPITKREIIKNTKLSFVEVETALNTIGVPYDAQLIKQYPNGKDVQAYKDELFVLGYPYYRQIRLNDPNYSQKELELIKRNCGLVFDHLRYPKDHPAREMLVIDSKEAKEKPVKEVLKEGKKENRKDNKKDNKNDNKKEAPREVSKENRKETSEEASKLVSKQKTKETPKKVKEPVDKPRSLKRKREDESYYLDLASKFQTKYKEYETLYKSIQASKGKDLDGLKKLFDMHKNLESWKRQLWKSVQ
jgi:hypothetical protein